ncbi:MAG: DNA adenine methylase [Bacilli bacterium]
MKSYTPLRYPGGKAKIYQFVHKLISDNFSSTPEYAEPYSGGFGLGLKLLLNGHVSKVYINDLDSNIYSFWYSVFYDTDNLINLINNTNISVEEWKNQRQIYLDQTSPFLCKGFATFFLNRTNRSGILNARPIGGFDQTGNYKIDCRFNKKNLISLIELLSTYKDKVELYNLDGLSFIEHIEKKDSNILLYLDPPYVLRGRELYKNSFTSENHISLRTALEKLTKPWFLTYDEADLIETLYGNMNIQKYKISYSLQSKRQSNEIIVFSDKIAKYDLSLLHKTQNSD